MNQEKNPKTKYNNLIAAVCAVVLALAGVGGYMMVEGWYNEGLQYRLEASAGAAPIQELFGQDQGFEAIEEFQSTDPAYTFEYPVGAQIEEFEEANGGRTLQLDYGEGTVEVHHSRLDARRSLAKRVIRQRIEADYVGSINEVILPNAGPGYVFQAQVPYFAGTSTQVWFRNDEHMMQVRSNPAGAQELRSIVESWSWSDE